MTLRCLNCGEICDEDELVTVKGDDYEYFGEKGTMKSKGCPSCEWDEFEEVHLCECGENYIECGEELCDECKQEIANDFRSLYRGLSEAGQEYLLNLLEDDDYVEKL